MEDALTNVRDSIFRTTIRGLCHHRESRQIGMLNTLKLSFDLLRCGNFRFVSSAASSGEGHWLCNLSLSLVMWGWWWGRGG